MNSKKEKDWPQSLVAMVRHEKKNAEAINHKELVIFKLSSYRT